MVVWQDFPAHSNYCELALIELGYHNVFTHCGTATQIHLHGKTVYPLVTGMLDDDGLIMQHHPI